MRGSLHVRVSVRTRTAASATPTSARIATASGPSASVETIAAGPSNRARVCHWALPRDGLNASSPPRSNAVGRPSAARNAT